MTDDDCPYCSGRGFLEADAWDWTGEHISETVDCEHCQDDAPDDDSAPLEIDEAGAGEEVQTEARE